MNTEMDLTDFRRDLSDVIDNLTESGPLRLMRYGGVVAEIRSATPEGDRRYAEKILETFRYLGSLADDLIDSLEYCGIDTIGSLVELAERHKVHCDAGVSFASYPGSNLPEKGPITLDEALAYLYFGVGYPKGAEDPHSWFLACVAIQDEAAKRGMSRNLPSLSYEEDGQTFVGVAIESGHTPQTIVDFAITALENGVDLNQLADMIGKDPVPADVLAMDHYNGYAFSVLTEAGLPHVEAVEIFRRGLDTSDAACLAEAGIRTADEIQKLLASGIRVDLAFRAHLGGVSTEEWKTQVPRIQHLKYRGYSHSPHLEEKGLLPFQLLSRAADEGVSLVRWDSSSLPVEEEDTLWFHADPEHRKIMYPWFYVYDRDDHVLQAARAGLSPSYVTAFGKLMRHHYRDHPERGDFLEVAIQAKKLGLTASMANVMSRPGGMRPKFSPAQLIALLEVGLTSGTAHYLTGKFADPNQWFQFMEERAKNQLMTEAFVAALEKTREWEALIEGADLLKGIYQKDKSLSRGNVYLMEVLENFTTSNSINDHQLSTALAHIHYSVLKISLPIAEEWRKKYGEEEKNLPQIEENFSRLRLLESSKS